MTVNVDLRQADAVIGCTGLSASLFTTVGDSGTDVLRSIMLPEYHKAPGATRISRPARLPDSRATLRLRA